MDAENYFEALVDEACKETVKNETWMKIYGHQYQDLLIINLDNRKAPLDRTTEALIEPYMFEIDVEKEAPCFTMGVKELRQMLSAGEYPRIDYTIAVIRVLKKAVAKVVDLILVTEAYRLISQLLRALPPSNRILKPYRHAIFLRLIGVDTDDADNALKIRGKFLAFLKEITDAKENESQQLASTALLRILCEFLEIDFASFLNGHTQDARTAMFSGKSCPKMSSLFWPHAMIQVGSLQSEFLSVIVDNLLDGPTNAESRDLYCRFLAMVLELIRLTEKDETVDEVSTSKTPRTLRRFLVDSQALSDQGVLDRLKSTVTFGWFKRAVEERKREIGDA